MAKFKLNKPSKRQSARLRYRIEKKVANHKRKLRKENKKEPKKRIQIRCPNVCPFKEAILKDVEDYKKEEERQKLEKKMTQSGDLTTMASSAKVDETHEKVGKRNAVKVSTLNNPIKPATAILQRVPRQKMMEMYDINEYHTPTEFFSFLAARMGRFKKGGVPNAEAAARNLLEDWNKGKIKYYTLPPEVDNQNIHVSSTIVTTAAKKN